MSQINLAVNRLKAARDLLADKIAEIVNEAGDEFAEDFTAGGYRSSAADELMELGERFYKLTYLIAAMPVERQPSSMSSYVQVVQHSPAFIPSWTDFADFAEMGNIETAADHLQLLLRVDAALAYRATQHFTARLAANYEGTLGELNSMTAQLCATTTGALNLLRDLFGLQGNTAISVYERLKASI